MSSNGDTPGGRNHHSEAVRDDWDAPAPSPSPPAGLTPHTAGRGGYAPRGGFNGQYSRGGHMIGPPRGPPHAPGFHPGPGMPAPMPHGYAPRGPLPPGHMVGRPGPPPFAQGPPHAMPYGRPPGPGYGGPPMPHMQHPHHPHAHPQQPFPQQLYPHQQHAHPHPHAHMHGHGPGPGHPMHMAPRGPPLGLVPRGMPAHALTRAPPTAAAAAAAVPAGMHPLLLGAAPQGSAVPLPPMPAPMAFMDATADTRFGPDWHGSREDHKRDFKAAMRRVLRDLERGARVGGVKIAAEPLPVAVVQYIRDENGARKWAARGGVGGGGGGGGSRATGQAQAPAAATAAAAVATAPADSAAVDAEASAPASAAPAADADFSAAAEPAAAEPAAAEPTAESRKATLLAALPADSPFRDDAHLEAALEFYRYSTLWRFRYEPALSLQLVTYLEEVGQVNPAVVLFCLIRLSVRYRVAPLIKAYVARQPSPAQFVNVPLPTEDSWFIHRAVWEGDTAVVRVLAGFGAVTNRYNRYHEHPVQVFVSRFEQQSEAGRRPYMPFEFEPDFQPRVTQRDVDAMRAVLQETLFVGAGPRAPDAVLVESLRLTERERERGVAGSWLDAVLKESAVAAEKMRERREGRRAGAADTGGAAGAAAAAEDEDKEDEGAAVSQRHVFVYGIPFEYPMADVKTWFGACGEVTNMHAFVNKGSFTAVKRSKTEEEDETAAAATAASSSSSGPQHLGECVIEFADAVCVAKALTYDKYPLLTRTIHVTLHRATPGQRRTWTAEARAKRVADQDASLTASERQQHAAATARPIAEIKTEAAERRRQAKERAEQRAGKAAEKKNRRRAAKEATADAAGSTGAAEAGAPMDASGSGSGEDGSWTASLVSSPAQTHVHVSNFPFEASFATDVLPRLEAVVRVRRYYVPTRALRPNSAFDQKIAANLPAGTTEVHRSSAVVELASVADVTRLIVALDGAAVDAGTGDRALRVTRNKVEAVKFSAEENKAREAAGRGPKPRQTAFPGAGKKAPAKSFLQSLPNANVAAKKAKDAGPNAFASASAALRPLSEMTFDVPSGGADADVAAPGESPVLVPSTKRARRGGAGAGAGADVQLAAPAEEGEVVDDAGEFYL